MERSLENAPLRQYCDVAIELAHAAGNLLLEHRSKGVATETKRFRRELVTAADRKAEHLVVGGLLRHFPDHGVLAEEGVLTPQGKSALSSDWTWIVDPLDGTTNFVHGLPFFAVAIGLAFRNEPVVGVVHAPALGQTYVAVQGQGATCNGLRLHVSSTKELADALLATGFSYHRDDPFADDNLARIARVLPQCRDLRRFGSAELDLCLVAAGSFDAFWEVGLAPYDVAAGAVMVQEAGGFVTDLAGGTDWLFGRQVLASNGTLHAIVRQQLAVK
ncbi:inositol monophosphatase [Planctomycetota bacterium]|jgi:myo-inositol-1(or 4)-monophosphatase|nr:inositol monophosphatase [Planctomycetota bacterium]GDY01878.1 inositol monophosphatase [Planctomycetota bacterium]